MTHPSIWRAKNLNEQVLLSNPLAMQEGIIIGHDLHCESIVLFILGCPKHIWRTAARFKLGGMRGVRDAAAQQGLRLKP